MPPPAPDSTLNMQIPRAIDRNTNLMLRRVPPIFLGSGFLLIIFGFIAWALKDTYLQANNNSEKITAIENQLGHCNEMRQVMQKEIAWLREENTTLKQRLSTLEETVRNKMP